MRSNFTYVRLLLLCFLFTVCINDSKLLAQSSTGTASGVATFQCIGITWSGSGGNASIPCNVKYRETGNGTWKNGYPLWFDSRAAGNGIRPANEYRGSIVNLTPGTTYEIELSLEGRTTTYALSSTTWSENFPIGTTNIVTSRSTTLSITSGGTANAWQLYTPSAVNAATIDVNNAADNCIYINAPYVIIRGLILKGAKGDAIKLGPNAHDVVIEYNDISGWGTASADGWGRDGDAGVRVSNSSSVERIIIQRNRIHHPRTNSNSWEEYRSSYNTNHPAGPQGITFESAGGNHVIRYNEIYSDATHYFNDGIGGAENFSYAGFPHADSDIYGNRVSQAWDDGIESEGANMNVRIWGNYLDSTFVKIAIASTSIGPVYIFRNVSNVSRRSAANDPNIADNEDRGPFIKAGTSYTQFSGGKIYVFHNTILQPVVPAYAHPLGCGGGIQDWGGGPMTPVESRNNILHVHKNWWQSVGDNYSGQTDNDFDYDLYNGMITGSNGQEQHGWKDVPVYNSANPRDVWNLAATSSGYDAGTLLNNFTDGFTGAGPDAGAYETGAAALEFGVNAYLTNPPPPPPPVNQPPIARAGNDITITLPTILAILDGSASSDPDGTIRSYSWTWVNGPSAFSLISPLTVITSVTGLIQGTYTFRLTVTDDDGATATDEVKVIVNPLIPPPPPPNQPPTANAGNNITITLPLNSVTVNGGNSADADGTISAYTWSYVNGPGTYSITSPAASSTTITGLVQGTYTFRLTVKDDDNAIATDDIIIVVNPAPVPPPPPPNQAPVAKAGTDIVITLPLNTVSVSGSSSTDADGTIVSYVWSWVSGPPYYSINNASLASININNLVQGVYVFKLTVTDDDGATASDNITITVNAQPVQPPPASNIGPVANAGNELVVIMPVNTAMLYGAGSTDPDGLIVGYEWTQVSGPSQLIIANNRLANIQLTELMLGVYVFQLKVTDNYGATAMATVKVTVKNKNGEDIYCNVYPNPTRSVVNVQYIVNNTGSVKLTLYDGSKKYLWGKTVPKTQSILNTTVDLTKYRNGTYYLEIVLEGSKTVVKKIVKL